MRILLAVDGSKQSEEAARALAHLARAEEVIVLHALDVPEPAYPMMMPEVARDIRSTVERGMREKGERLLAGVAALLPPRTGPVTKRLEVGKPADLIVTIAQEQRVNLIVLGSRGLGPVKERLLGSVSHRVLAHAPCAALMVNRRIRALRQVLLPLQGPDDVEAAVAFLATKPFREAVDVTILTVPPFTKPAWPVGASVSEAVKKDLLEGARLFVEDVASRLRALDYRVQGAAVLGAPATVILKEATKRKVDLILMGARGRRGITRFVLGSVSHAVLHRAPCPVLVFR
jgi:nucleotide-binding universal stress UspA family protein